MDKKDQEIEQLQVQLSGLKGLLGEIVSLQNLFMPILEALPQTDKRMLGELKKRMQITQMMLDMERQNPPVIKEAMGGITPLY